MKQNERQQKQIVFFGDSLTAGYNLAPHESFPAVIQQKLNLLGYNYHVVNKGVSGNTTADGLERIDRVLQQPAHIFVLALGANDGLRQVDTQTTKRNLQTLINKVKSKYPKAILVLAGMLIPPANDTEYQQRFGALFPQLAHANGLPFVPFLLQGVGGKPELNLPDGLHPTAQGYRMVADNVWQVLQPLLDPSVM